jgi:hypothetical protein
MTDHRHINFNIKGISFQVELFKNPKRTKWALYRESLKEQLNGVNSRIGGNNEVIHTAVSWALDFACHPMMSRSSRKMP